MGPAVLLLADVSLSWLPFRRKILGICLSTIFSPTPYNAALRSSFPMSILEQQLQKAQTQC